MRIATIVKYLENSRVEHHKSRQPSDKHAHTTCTATLYQNDSDKILLSMYGFGGAAIVGGVFNKIHVMKFCLPRGVFFFHVSQRYMFDLS